MFPPHNGIQDNLDHFLSLMMMYETTNPLTARAVHGAAKCFAECEWIHPSRHSVALARTCWFSLLQTLVRLLRVSTEEKNSFGEPTYT